MNQSSKLLYLPISMSATSVKVKVRSSKAPILSFAQSAKEKENLMSIIDISKDCTSYSSTDRALSRSRKKFPKNP